MRSLGDGGGGVRVYGAASMGALRAAELDAFGMVGIGKIYESYRVGRYDAVRRSVRGRRRGGGAPRAAGDGLRPTSRDAMVDVRETLAAAETEGLIDADVRDRLPTATEAAALPGP